MKHLWVLFGCALAVNAQDVTGSVEKGKTILMTSHLFHTLADTCDYIHHLNNGVIEKSYAKKDFYQLEKLLEETIKSKTDVLVKEAINISNT